MACGEDLPRGAWAKRVRGDAVVAQSHDKYRPAFGKQGFKLRRTDVGCVVRTIAFTDGRRLNCNIAAARPAEPARGVVRIDDDAYNPRAAARLLLHGYAVRQALLKFGGCLDSQISPVQAHGRPSFGGAVRPAHVTNLLNFTARL